MSAQTLAELIHARCDANLDRILRLPTKNWTYELITFQVQLSRLDFGMDRYAREVRVTRPQNLERARLLRNLADCRLVIHTFLTKIEKCLQSLRLQNIREAQASA